MQSPTTQWQKFSVKMVPKKHATVNEWHVAGWYRDAWPRLPAFVIPGFSDAHIRINLAGRERDGVVALDDYDAACDDVERSLRACRSARTGDPIVADITRMRAGDPCAPDGPGADLVVRLWGTDAIEHPDAGSIGPAVAMRTGSHTEHGFADISGPGIEPGDRGAFGVCDLSATICALLGRTARVPLDGRSFLD